MRYRADPQALRRTRALDGVLTAIFHRPSATTHVVAAPVPEILEALSDGPADAATLLARLAAVHDLDGGEGELAAHLEELVAAALVSRA